MTSIVINDLESSAATMTDPQNDASCSIAASDISLTLGTRRVLDSVSFSIRPGELFGILGPNGSGKSSLFRCLTGLWEPDHGTFSLLGTALSSRTRTLRAKIGVVFQDPSLDAKLSLKENLVFGGKLMGLSQKEASSRADELLVFMEIQDRANDRVETLSGGLKRRVEIARALIHRPEVLVLDEPTNGLDFRAQERLWRRLLALRAQEGLTLLLTTHRADEAEMCDRVAILNEGRIVACDAPEALLQHVSGDVIILRTTRIEDVLPLLEEHFGNDVVCDGSEIRITYPDGHTLVPRLVEMFPEGAFDSISVSRPSLSHAFHALTGSALSDD